MINKIKPNSIISKISIVFIVLNILVSGAHALEMLEPIIQELDTTNYVDIGYTSPGEKLLISFLTNSENYENIELAQDTKKWAFIENTQKTKESIFTTININENVEGIKKINLILKSKTKSKTIILNTHVSNNVIYTQILPYNKKTNINRDKLIKIRVFNKSQSTKKIIIDSSLNDYWFNNSNRNQIYLLQPNSTTIINYIITPPIIGTTNFEVYIFKKYNDAEKLSENLKNINNYNVEEIELNIIKDLNSIYSTKKHQFPLFGLNTIPIYFFNNIIKLL